MKRKNMFQQVRSKLISAVLAAALCVSALTGCGVNNADTGSSPSQDNAENDTASADTSENKDTVAADLEPVTLKLWSCSDKYAAQDEILAKFCEKYKE